MISGPAEPLLGMAQCRAFAESLGTRSMSVAGVLTADASRPDDVAAVFDEVLEHLLSTTDAVDASLVRLRSEALLGLVRPLQAVLEAGRGLIGSAAEDSPLAARRVVGLTNQVLEDLFDALERFAGELSRHRDDPDEVLREAVAHVVIAAREDKDVASADEVTRLIALEGGKSLAYGRLLNQARAKLARHFVALEPALQMSVATLKRDIADILAHKGRLSALAGDPDTGWIGRWADELALAVSPGSPVYKALITLDDAQMTYRGFLQHRVRPHLDCLSSDSPFIPMPSGGECSAQDICDMVEVAYDHALRAVDEMLRNELVAEPSRAVFALGEEFIDGSLRTRGALDDWRTIYLQYKNRIWPDEWEALTKDMADMARWRQALTTFERTVSAFSSRPQEPLGE
jgi:hypothetical protein